MTLPAVGQRSDRVRVSTRERKHLGSGSRVGERDGKTFVARAYYNESNKKAAAWLRVLIQRGLIPDGEVDERSIESVRPADVRGFTQCHWFAGIGGWPLAFRLAGWPDSRPVWSGSCPCQPHSSAARGRNVRPDLWAPFGALIAAEHPPVVFGEQVDEARPWLDGVCNDLEALEYAVWATVLPAYSAGADHARERIYFVGHANGQSESVGAIDGEVARMQRAGGDAGDVVSADGVSARVALLRGFGNAIYPELAAQFIGAYMDVMDSGPFSPRGSKSLSDRQIGGRA